MFSSHFLGQFFFLHGASFLGNLLPCFRKMSSDSLDLSSTTLAIPTENFHLSSQFQGKFPV